MPTGARPTLTQFLIEERRRHPGATGELNALVTDVSLACKAIARKVAFGALADMVGAAPQPAPGVNVHGEEQTAYEEEHQPGEKVEVPVVTHTKTGQNEIRIYLNDKPVDPSSYVVK